MQAADVVVSDTSPLLGLALIDRLDLVRTQFSVIVVPEQVWSELTAGEDGVAKLQSLHDDGTLEVVTVDETALFTEFRRTLDEGEASTLAHAIEKDADLVLLDEREARQAARRHELPVTGAIGILLRAAEGGGIDLQSELDALREAGFWISETLYEDVLDLANE